MAGLVKVDGGLLSLPYLYIQSLIFLPINIKITGSTKLCEMLEEEENYYRNLVVVCLVY